MKMDTSRLLIVTAADETFVPLLKGLVESLHRHGTPQRGHFACLDVGLAAGSRDWLRGYTDRVVNPEWDIPLDDALAIAKPHLRAITARPFLPRYFPGYDIYLWMDADTWVQEWYAIDWYAAAAADGRLAIAAEVDRSYQQPVDVWKWRMERLFAYYGETAAKLLYAQQYYNSGVFALRADAPHWEIWASGLRRGVDATNGTLCTDQTALNYMIWSKQLPTHPLPAVCNWMCHLAKPIYVPQTGRFHEPFLPHQAIGIMHLAHDSKDHTFETRDDKGHSIRSNLRFSPDRKSAASPK